MSDSYLRYDQMVERALRGVVREALTQAAEHGLVGDHHFYLTFQTAHPEVDVPPYLRDKYADEMTIVLQYQFYDLIVEEDRFLVTLSFNNKLEPLHIPFAAITTFADPSVNFALQFQALPSMDEDGEEDEDATGEDTKAGSDDTEARGDGADGTGDDDGAAKVITLDRFRKK